MLVSARSFPFAAVVLLGLLGSAAAAGTATNGTPMNGTAGVHAATPEGVGAPLVIAPDKGFVDDAFAFDAAGARLAWVQADTEGMCLVHVVDLASGKDSTTIDLARTFTSLGSLRFVRGGQALLAVGTVASKSGTAKPLTAVVGLDGKIQRKWDAALTYAQNGAVELVVQRDAPTTAAPENITYVVRAYDLATGKTVGAPRTLAVKDGFVKSIGLAPLYWADSFLHLHGKKRGEFDKKTDQLQPDSDAIYDVITGKIIADKPITDVPAFVMLTEVRRAYDNTATILHFKNDGQLELVTADDRRLPVATALPINHYVGKSLVVADDARAFTLTVDPVNAEAVKRQSADPIHIDLYSLDAQSGTAKRLARVPAGEGESTWHYAPGHWAFLRKHKGLGRGGPKLEVFPLTGAAK